MRPVVGLLWLAASCATNAPHGTHRGPVTAVCTLPGLGIAACSQGGVLLRHGPGPWVHLGPPRGRALAMALVPGTGYLLAGGGQPGTSGRLWLLAREGPCRFEQHVADDVVYAVAVSPDGALGAAGCADGRTLVWDLRRPLQRPEERHRHGGPCRAVAFSPDGSLLASAGRDGRLVLLPLPDGPAVECPGHTDGIDCLLLRHSGDLASGARDGRVRVHDQTGRLLRTWHWLGAPVLSLAETDRGLFAGLADGRIVLLLADREAPEPLITLPAPVHALAAADGALHAGIHGAVVELRLDQLAEPDRSP